MNGTVPAQIWQRHPGLVWSNAGADAGVRLRAALLRPRFDTLLDLALHFGLPRLRKEWAWPAEEDPPEVRRARAPVERILRNIEEGFARVTAGNQARLGTRPGTADAGRGKP